jgi:hypothetical protein
MMKSRNEAELSADDLISLNGIDGTTGNYLVPPMPPTSAVALARGKPQDRERSSWLKRISDMLRRPFLGLPLGVEPTIVAQAGWAIVFAKDTSEEVRAALQPLVAHRRTHVPPDRGKVLEYRPGEAWKDWLKRHGAYPGSLAPTRMPYYVLLVGDPTAIPFEFQYLLDVEYAVGRLAFDRPEQYRQYAESIVAYETATTLPNGKEVVYWGTRHPTDRATQLSADYLIAPLALGKTATGDPHEPAIADALSYRSQCLKGRDATRSSLSEVLHAHGAALPPAMLFTASHGLGWPKKHKQQWPAQGALLCQDWTGFGSVQPGHYLAAADLTDDARVHGLVAFLFACYGAGTPAVDNFLEDCAGGPKPIAEQPFVAALPQRLLSHPQGTALAVIGHVDRAWGYSIRPPGVGPQLQPFRNFIGRVLGGEPVGHAMKDFSEKYATLSTELLSNLDDSQTGPRSTDEELAWMWIERNDAQNYVVLGDPAVRLRVNLLKH